MSKLKWDQIGERLAETGVDQAVLYPFAAGVYGNGVPWNGMTSMNEAPTGAEASPFYADNRKYLEIMSEEEFAASLGCYCYPDEFKPCIGEKEIGVGITAAQQTHQLFGLSYRTRIVNDVDGVDHGFKIHLVYSALAGVSTRDHATMNDSPELEEISFDLTTSKVDVPNAKPSAHLVIDSTKFTELTKPKLQKIMDALYGVDANPSAVPPVVASEPKLLSPAELLALLA